MHFYLITIIAAILAPVIATQHTVTIKDFSFMPQSLAIQAGDLVIWFNDDNTAHTVTSDSKSFDSGNIAPQEMFSITFNTTAIVTYHCSIHPFMQASIGGSSAASTTSSTSALSATPSPPAHSSSSHLGVTSPSIFLLSTTAFLLFLPSL